MKCFRCHQDMGDLPANYPHRPCDGGPDWVKDKEWFCALEPSTAFDIYWWIRNSAPPAEEAIRIIDSNLGEAAARGIMAERNSDNFDLLTFLRDKTYPTGDMPKTTTIGNRQAVIINLSIRSPETDGEMLGQGKIEIEYILVAKGSN